MPAMRVKEEHFASMNLAKSRDVTGKARRAPKA
jgi:hypothetical protein